MDSAVDKAAADEALPRDALRPPAVEVRDQADVWKVPGELGVDDVLDLVLLGERQHEPDPEGVGQPVHDAAPHLGPDVQTVAQLYAEGALKDAAVTVRCVTLHFLNLRIKYGKERAVFDFENDLMNRLMIVNRKDLISVLTCPIGKPSGPVFPSERVTFRSMSDPWIRARNVLHDEHRMHNESSFDT